MPAQAIGGEGHVARRGRVPLQGHLLTPRRTIPEDDLAGLLARRGDVRPSGEKARRTAPCIGRTTGAAESHRAASRRTIPRSSSAMARVRPSGENAAAFGADRGDR